MAAVSARRMRLPKVTDVHLDAWAISWSDSLHPPSGPTARTTSLSGSVGMVIIMRLAPSERSLRISLCAEVVEESQLANSTGGSMIGTSQHSDCCAASK